MKSITIYPPEELLMKWQKIASNKGITVEKLIVSIVEERLNDFAENLKNDKSQDMTTNQPNTVVYADFSEMANDPEYQEEALAICREFEKSDWEALQLGESEYETR